MKQMPCAGRWKCSTTAVLCTAALTAACWPVFRTPEVRLETVRLGSLSLTGATLVANIVVSNPNSYDLRSAAMSYELDLNDEDGNGGWVRLAQGVLDREFHVAARDSATLQMPLDISFSGVSSAARSLLSRGAVDYRMGGNLALTRPVNRRVPFRRTGTVSLVVSN